MSIATFLLTLIAIFAAAKLFGEIAERLGQPAVLGELLGGIVVGVSGLHLVNPHDTTIHLLSQLAVILLLFLIGLETDLHKLMAVGVSSTAVAVVGVALPFILGYACGVYLGYSSILSLFLGAALTATSVGITARVLSDLGHLHDPESQVILGAAVIDDIIGLVLLTIVTSLAAGQPLTTVTIARVSAIAFGFVAIAIVVGGKFAPYLIKLIARLRVGGALFFTSLMFALALAYLAESLGSAMIVGSFAAGLVLAKTEKGPQIGKEVHGIAQFFIPIFFVSVGAAVDLGSMNPFDPATRKYFVIGVLLTAVAIIGKIAAGWAAPDSSLRKIVIGVGMIPRGEVGLIFAQIGLAAKLLDPGLYSSIALMVIVTTFVTPIVLRGLLTKMKSEEVTGVAELVTESPMEDE